MTLRHPTPTWPDAWPRPVPAPPSGRAELLAAEVSQGGASRPDRVTALLSGLCATIGGQPATADFVRGLAAGTREWLLQQIAADCRPAPDWFDATCPDCGEVFDLSFDLAQLPRSGPGPGFPAVTVATAAGDLDFDCLNGWHEEALARGQGGTPAGVLALAARFPDADRVLPGLPPADLAAIEAALDAAAPEVADAISAPCPACGAMAEARIDPLAYAFPREGRLLAEVHMLSFAYKWTEEAILALPSARRRAYVGMVAAAAGPQPGLAFGQATGGPG